MWFALALAFMVLAQASQGRTAPFYFGADLSYVNEMEDCGAQYRDRGVRSDPFVILHSHGANLVRVRLWNSPEWTRYSTLPDVEKTIARARAQHMQVLLDFHYSDTWADGDHQTIPKAWANIKGADAQAKLLYQFTFDTLRALDARGLMPDIVQVGNESNPELMGNGQKDQPIDWVRNAKLFKAGIAAVRAAGALSSTHPKVMVHIAQPEHADEWFPKATAAGITGYDIIGLSYYPKWSKRDLPGLGQTISNLHTTYGVDVMVVETGYPWTLENVDPQANLLGQDGLLTGYPATPVGQARFLTDLTQTIIDHGGNGVVYWEPAWVSTHCSTPWGQGSSWENATLFDFHKGNDALPAMDFMRHSYR